MAAVGTKVCHSVVEDGFRRSPKGICKTGQLFGKPRAPAVEHGGGLDDIILAEAGKTGGVALAKERDGSRVRAKAVADVVAASL